MLWLISLGIGENSISLEGLEAGKTCQSLYLEQYTTSQFSRVELEKVFGMNIQELDRKGVEEGSLVEEAKTKDIGLLVGGDALSATTHLALVLDCKKQNVPYRIVHGSSILTAIGESGLSLYKFGETITVPRPAKGFKPSGFYETILKNHENGLHTLILLEIDMPAREGLGILLDIEKDKSGELFKSNKIVSLSKVGSENQIIWYGPAVKVPEGEPPAVLILPGRLNAFEIEFLESI